MIRQVRMCSKKMFQLLIQKSRAVGKIVRRSNFSINFILFMHFRDI